MARKVNLYNMSLVDSGYFSKSTYPTLFRCLENNSIFNIGALLEVTDIDRLDGPLRYKKKLELMGIIDLIKYEYLGSPIDAAVFLEDEVVVLDSHGDSCFRWVYQTDWANEKLPRMGFDMGDIKSLEIFIETLAKEGKYHSLRLIDIFNMHNLRYPGGKTMACKKMKLYSKFYSEQVSVVDEDYANICHLRDEIERLKLKREEIDFLILEKEKEFSSLLETKVKETKVFQKSEFKGNV